MTIRRKTANSDGIKVAVVGAGYMGLRYARIVKEHPATELAAVVDLNLELATKAASMSGAEAYQSVDEALEGSKPHAIVVATFEDSHVEPCVKALEADIAVLVEKPIANEIDGSARILSASDHSAAPLMVGHLLRFDSRYSALKDAVHKGEVGQPLTAFARRLNTVGAQDRLRGRSTLPLFLGVHDFDILRWVLADEVVEVRAVARKGHLRDLGHDVEDAVFATLHFTRGTVALVELGWILPAGHPSGFDQRLEVTGSKGWTSVDGDFSGFSIASTDRVRWPDTIVAPIIENSMGGALERSFSAFIDSIMTQSDPPISGRDGHKALEVALAVQESIATGRTVPINSINGN